MRRVEMHSPEINTVQGAKDLLSIDGLYTTEYIQYTVGVVKKVKALVELLEIDEQSANTLIIATYLHNIGRFLDPKKSPFHQANAYIHLKELGWSEDICLLVKYHLGAYDLNNLVAPNKLCLSYKEDIPKRLETLNDILTVASLLTGTQGELVTLEQRVQLAIERYNPKHVRVEHINNLVDKTKHLLTNWFILET